MEDFSSAGEAEIRSPRGNIIHGPGCSMTPVKPVATNSDPLPLIAKENPHSPGENHSTAVTLLKVLLC
jgi:hypothetical protein